MACCELTDLFSFGLPRGALRNPGRLVSANTSADAFDLDVHGLALDDALSFRAGAGGSLPSPLAAGTTYYAVPVTESRFQVAASAGGAAINLTTAGESVIAIVPLPEAAVRAWATSVVEDMLPAAMVPLDSPYPPIVVATTAELAAARLLLLAGQAPSEPLATIMDHASKRLARWAKHVPIRGTNAPSAAGLAVTATTAQRDSSGWRAHGGTI